MVKALAGLQDGAVRKLTLQEAISNSSGLRLKIPLSF